MKEKFGEVSKEVLAQLEKEVDQAGTFYMVWQTRENKPNNVDIYFSEKVTEEDIARMIKYLTVGCHHKFH